MRQSIGLRIQTAPEDDGGSINYPGQSYDMGKSYFRSSQTVRKGKEEK